MSKLHYSYLSSHFCSAYPDLLQSSENLIILSYIYSYIQLFAVPLGVDLLTVGVHVLAWLEPISPLKLSSQTTLKGQEQN